MPALGHSTHFSYHYAYPNNGQLVLQVTKADPLGNQEVTIHDTHGHVSSFLCYNSLGQVTQSETFAYDLKGQRIQSNILIYSPEASREIITAWEYDFRGNVTSCTEAKGTPEQKTTQFNYDFFGRKIRMIKPDGIILLHTHDSLGRLKRLQSSDFTIDYTYDYDPQDHLRQVDDLIHQTKTLRTYDAYGHLETETLGTGDTLTYTYDPLDRLLTLTLPDHSSIHYRYNAHHLTAVRRYKDDALAYAHSYLEYDLSGKPLKEELIAQAGILSHQYDALQRVISLQAPYWQETISSDGYDAVGNLLKRQVHDSQGALTYIYAYDDLYQLIAETGVQSHTYCNDSVYNRVVKDEQSYSFNALNQLIDPSYLYDDNGNLTRDGDTTYRYDALDRLIEVKRPSHLTNYTYDFSHRRLSKTHDGEVTHYLYQGQNEIGAIEQGKITQLRLLGISHGAEIGAAVAIELEDIPYAPIHDPQGNIVALIDAKGHLAESYRYTAFGEIFPQTNLDNPWRYSSKREDPETGFVYFGRRYYSSTIGRWITPDPAGFADGPNLYAYVHNHPLAYIDPDGQFAFLLPFVVPIAMSIAENCLPLATSFLEQYSGGATAGAFLTGLAHGYNWSIEQNLSPSAIERTGLSLGIVFSLNPINLAKNVVNKTATHVITREVGGATANVISKKTQSWVSSSLFQKTAPMVSSTQTRLAKNVTKEYGAVEQATKQVVDKAGRNRFVPDINATGAHTVFRRDPMTGKITHYETYRPQTNPFDPKRWESLKRYDGLGKSHRNKILKQNIETPHIHDPSYPGEIRYPEFWEIP